MNNLNMKLLQFDVEKFMKDKGYAYFDKGSYNLNIIGVRRMNKKVSNSFDDALIVRYIDGTGYKCTNIYDITTDPGLKSMKAPINAKGCAILVSGQYRSSWRIGFHKGKYQALVQDKPVKVYRDNNKDSIYDLNNKTIEEGMFGINIHKAGASSIVVDGWSAGCQVFAKELQFNEFMRLCYKQIENGFGKNFTYTLIDEKDISDYISKY